jgi:hypothetical protein
MRFLSWEIKRRKPIEIGFSGFFSHEIAVKIAANDFYLSETYQKRPFKSEMLTPTTQEEVSILLRYGQHPNIISLR